MRHPAATTPAGRRPVDLAVGLGALFILAAAILVLPLRPLVLAAAVVAFLGGRPGSSVRWAAAAVLPAALLLTWGVTVDAWMTDGTPACSDPASPLAVSRVLEAAAVIILIALLARRLGTRFADLGLRRPGRAELVLGLAAVLLIPGLSLALGPILAEPFFGPMRLELAPLALVPAIALAVANGTMEELVYRGALMRWDARLAGPGIALVGQAVIFGLAHLGDDFVGSPLPVLVVVGLGGLAAGIVARRTGSLFLPIVAHICFDVPLYFALVCRET